MTFFALHTLQCTELVLNTFYSINDELFRQSLVLPRRSDNLELSTSWFH